MRGRCRQCPMRTRYGRARRDVGGASPWLGPRPQLGGLFFRSRPASLPGGCTGSEEWEEKLRRWVSSRPRCCLDDPAGEPLSRVCTGLKCVGVRGLRSVGTRLSGPDSLLGSGGSAGAAWDGRGGCPGGSAVAPLTATLPPIPWAETVQPQHPRVQYRERAHHPLNCWWRTGDVTQWLSSLAQGLGFDVQRY